MIGCSTIASTIVEPRLTITLFIRPPCLHEHYSFDPNVRITELFRNSGTPLMRPPRQCDLDFMAQRWSH